MDKIVIYIDINNQIIEYILPAYNNRKGILNLYLETGIREFLISYEVWDGEWHFLTNDYIRLSQNHKIVEDKVLCEGDVLQGKVYANENRFILMINILNQETAVYEKYDIRNSNSISIGSHANCDIVCNEKFISSIHAVLTMHDNGWYIYDQSSNGTYLNHHKIGQERRLHVFDTIYMVGFKVVYLGCVLAINRTHSTQVKLPIADLALITNYNLFKDQAMFSRSPRLIEPFDMSEIELEMPPSPIKQTKTPLIFILGPSLTMPVPILMTVLFNVLMNSGRGTSVLSYFGMAISVLMFAGLGVMWTLLRNKYDRRMLAENEEARINAYNNYIMQNVSLLEEKHNYNKKILERKYINAQTLAEHIQKNNISLWNRNINHEDFLQIRMGIGTMESPNEVHVPKERFSVEQDSLATLPYAVYDKYKYLSPVPKLLDLKKHKIIGVVGNTTGLQKIANNIILQLAALHSYTDIRMAFFLQELGEEIQLEWTKWLPHVFSDDKKVRYISNSENSYKNVLYALTNELRSRKEQQKENLVKKRYTKHYIVFSTNKSLFENEMIYKYMVDEADYGFTFILLHGTMDALPNECKTIVGHTDKMNGIYQLDESITNKQLIQFDEISNIKSEEFARQISGVYINEQSEGTIPESIDYFESMKISNIEQWDLLKHYKENRSFEGMKALIGMSAGNKPIYLDIHEKKHGPHGLVAGTTGSGKSETIQTFIISLALNYHPDEVAFILIDYKGGGMANAFLGMPHLAGTITNLGREDNENMESIDDNQTRRALISIRSEIKRRQTIFNRYKVNHIDLYMRMYRDGKAKEPMPHLIIISDEFAELKKEQPEFIKELVSTARVGRSLGIHLILATQKPGGVVDDEIWSNSRFKLCLRVQDKQDSLGMLKRPEAAFLTTTGRAYLQIGNDEVFELFQSAYSGAIYEAKDELVVGQNEEITMIELDGTEAIIKTKEKTGNESTKTQLETCVNYIIQIANEKKIRYTDPLWLPQLPAVITLKELENRYKLNYQDSKIAMIGLVDHPEKQNQYPLVIELDKWWNLIVVGKSGSGKTSLLQTFACSIIRHYQPSEIQMYCLDFSSRTFKVFEKAPHFGGIIFSDENEKVTRLFKLIEQKVKQRKNQFGQAGVGSYLEYSKIDNEIPMIVVLIDNYFEFVELYSDLEENFLKLTREGNKYGIQFLVTMNNMNDMRYKVKQNFSKIIPIQLNEKGDYMDALGKTPEIMPTLKNGRGLIMYEEALEFQTALMEEGGSEVERKEALDKELKQYMQSYQGISAEKVPILPKNQAYANLFKEQEDRVGMEGKIPIGYVTEDISIASIDLHTSYCISVSSINNTSIVAYMNQILYYCNKKEIDCHFVHVNQNMSGFKVGFADGIYQNYDDLYTLLVRLKEEFRNRSTEWKTYSTTNKEADMESFCYQNFRKIIVIIDDMGAFEEIVYNTINRESMSALVEMFLKEGMGRGIYMFAGYPVDMNSNLLYMAASKSFMGYKKGIHFGGQLNQQKLFELVLPMSQQMKHQPDNIGFCIQNGNPIQIYIPNRLEEDGESYGCTNL
ncbi:MAG: type VII secretion protein EssC [Lachnospiraceae bacterium]